MMGVMLGILSAHNAHVNAKVGHVASRVHAIAPWYIAMIAGLSAPTDSTLAGRLQDAGLIAS